MPRCSVCGNEAGPIPPIPPWLAPWRDQAEAACSITCLAIISMGGRTLAQLSPAEREALEAASDAVGQYLDELNQTDLAKLSREQWMHLLAVAVTAWRDRVPEAEGGRARATA